MWPIPWGFDECSTANPRAADLIAQGDAPAHPMDTFIGPFPTLFLKGDENLHAFPHQGGHRRRRRLFRVNGEQAHSHPQPETPELYQGGPYCT